jgi:IS30 family transposase
MVLAGKTTSRNTNGLIRDYFPKGTDFNLVFITQRSQNQINERPTNT